VACSQPASPADSTRPTAPKPNRLRPVDSPKAQPTASKPNRQPTNQPTQPTAPGRQPPSAADSVQPTAPHSPAASAQPTATQPSRQRPADSPTHPSRQRPAESQTPQPTAPRREPDNPADRAQPRATQPCVPILRAFYTVTSVVRSVSDQFPLQRAMCLHDSGPFSFVLSKIQSETRTKTCLFHLS
jgi:hypothetical protein